MRRFWYSRISGPISFVGISNHVCSSAAWLGGSMWIRESPCLIFLSRISALIIDFVLLLKSISIRFVQNCVYC